MWKCPVCDKENEKPVCIECGFDSSTDLEHNPTLAAVGEVVAVSKRRVQFQAEREHLYFCPYCHGYDFRISQETSSVICNSCKSVIKSDQIFTAEHRIVDGGQCGEQVFWEFYDNGELRIYGNGQMSNYKNKANAPWFNTISQKAKRVQIESGVTSIGNRAFASCKRITKTTIPPSVKLIGYEAFCGCRRLSTIQLPNGVLIAPWAFRECSMKVIILPDSTSVINRGTFYDCKNLISIRIPKSVKRIRSDAFYGCDNLKNVYYMGSKPEWTKIWLESENEALKNANIHFNCK